MKKFSDRIFPIQRFLNINIFFLIYILQEKYSYSNNLESFLLENSQVNRMNDRCGTHNDTQGFHIICEGIRSCEHDIPVQVFSQGRTITTTISRCQTHVVRSWFLGVAIDVQYDYFISHVASYLSLYECHDVLHLGGVVWIKENQWSYNTKDSL